MSFHRSLILFLLAWVPAYAQNPAVAPRGMAGPLPIAAPAAMPLNGNALGDTKIVEDINEQNLDGAGLAGLYRRYTGRRVIVTTGAAAAQFKFVQEASPQDPLTFSKAAELLRRAAVLEGFVFVQHPDDPNLDILTLATGGPRPTNVNISVYNENSTLPDTDIVITYVMTLSYIKPDQAVQIFTQVVGQFGAYGSISSVPNASAVVITEKASLIKSLIELKKTIDVPGSVQATRFIKVQYADVTEIAGVLTELLTAQQSAQKTAGVQRAEAPQLPPGANNAAQVAAGHSASGDDTPVQIIPEPRTNRIFAMGRPVDLIFVENLVREFDIPSSEKTFLRRKLRFLTVSDFLPVAGNALTRAFTGTGDTTGASGGAASGSPLPRNQSNARQTSNTNSTRNTRSGSTNSLGGSSSGFGNSSSGMGGFGGSSSFGGGSSAGSSGSALSDPSVSSAPESLLVGRTLLVADNITNSIVAQGPPSALEIIERLLEQIDVRPDQVMISTVIGQLTLTKDSELGASYLLNTHGGKLLGGGGGGFPAVTNTTNAFPTVDKSTFNSAGLQAYGQIGDLSIALKALQSKTDFTVLSRPSIFTSNNQKGTISSGEKIAIPTGSNTYGGGVGNNTSTQIQYQDVVLKLEVIPLVNSDNEITMQIALLNDEQNGTQTIDGGAGNGQPLTVPKISTRTILTTATVPNNNTIVLGGLIVNRDGKDKSGIPILSSIPFLGRLFSSTKDTNNRSELMVFIQPSIVRNDRSLAAVQSDMDARYKVSPDANHFADGESVLPAKDSAAKPTTPKPTSSSNNAPKPLIGPPHRR